MWCRLLGKRERRILMRGMQNHACGFGEKAIIESVLVQDEEANVKGLINPMREYKQRGSAQRQAAT